MGEVLDVVKNNRTTVANITFRQQILYTFCWKNYIIFDVKKVQKNVFIL